MKIRLLLFVYAILLSGCGLLNFPTLNSPKPPDTVYKYNETFRKNPTAVAIGNKIVVVEEQERNVTAGYENKEKPLSAWQKFCNKLANLSILAIIVIFGCLAFGITGPLLFLIRRYYMAKKTLVQVVRGIGEAKAIEKDSVLKNTLSSMLDTNSKKLIDDIKRS